MADQLQFLIPDNDWVELAGINDSGFIWHQGGNSSVGSNVVFVRSSSKPAIVASDTRRFKDNPISSILPSGTGDFYNGVKTLWASSTIGEQLITVTPGAGELPSGLFSGSRAMNVQSYEESNIKLGLQFEGSKNFGTVAAGSVIDTVLKTGSLPVSLKKRLVSFTGEGVQGEIFINPSYTGGTPEQYQNATTINPRVGLSQVLSGVTLQDTGTLAFAPTYAFGNASNQGKGGVLTLIEPEHILMPNTDFLFRLTSLDPSAQNIASHITWYEGELDLPLASN